MTTPSPQIRRNLSVNLAEQSPSRLIELCLLYRVHPDQSPDFPARLTAEIARRYTEAELRNGDTEYSVLKKFLNEFKSPIPYAHQQLIEMSASVNRDIWFSNNEQQFKAMLDNETVMHWLVDQPQVLERCLQNRQALKWIAQSRKASTAILTHRTAVNQWKQADGLWGIWHQYQQGMEVLAQSHELVNYVMNLPLAWNAIKANTTAVTALANNRTAMEAICANQNAITHLVTNSSTWAILLNSQTAMNAVVGSTTAMRIVLGHDVAFNAMLASNIGLNALMESQVAMTALIENTTRFNAILNEDSKFEAILNSSSAMGVIVDNSAAFSTIANNANLLDAAISNSGAFAIICASPVAMKVVVNSERAKRSFCGNNEQFQTQKSTLYAMVKRHWVKKISIRGKTTSISLVTQMYTPLKNPNGLVFADVFFQSEGQNFNVFVEHPIYVNDANKYAIYKLFSETPIRVDNPPTQFNPAPEVVTFNKCSINNNGYAKTTGYAELWAPPE